MISFTSTSARTRLLLGSSTIMAFIMLYLCSITLYSVASSTPSANADPPPTFNPDYGESGKLLADCQRQRQRQRIVILQHFNLNDDRVHRLQNISREQHQRYADFWGYRYHCTFAQYIELDKTVRQRQMNKLYALLSLAIEEQGRGEDGADWIFITDADVLIRNPLIPLHALLPPDVDAFILGAEDFNGFNSGNMLYRCGLDLIAYLSRAIVVSDDITRAYDTAQSQSGSGSAPADMETPPSDQRALCLTLESNPIYADRFFHYPQHWLNAYPPDIQPMQLNTHMVADDKYRTDLDQFLESEREIMDRMRLMTLEEVRSEEVSVGNVAKEHWKTARVGLPKCIWV